MSDVADDDHPLLALGEDGPEDEEEVRIYEATCVQYGKSTWMPSVQLISGVKFIRVSKWDRRLTNFCTRRPLNLHSSGSRPLNTINVVWFDEIKSLRVQACNQAIRKVIEDGAEAEGSKKPEKIRKATQEDEFVAGRTVTIEAPPVVRDGAVVEPARLLRVLWGIRGDLWIELSTENLSYIRHAILNSAPYEQVITKRSKFVAKDGQSPRRRRKRGRKPNALQQRDSNDDDETPALEAPK